jgi:protein TonB
LRVTRPCEKPRVAFEAFTEKTKGGAFHQRRAIAYATAACILVGLGIASARINSHGAEPLPVKEPDPIDVTLEEKIEEEKPKEPEPEPPPAIEVPKHVKINAEPPPLPPKEPDPDTKAKLDEADPSKDKGVAGSHGGGDPNGHAGGSGTGQAKPEAPPCGGDGQACCGGSTCNSGLECAAAGVCRKPPPPPPKPAGPAMVSEDDTPAKGVSTPPPAYPAAARAAGTQGVVVVRLTIDEQGNVKDAKVVKGDSNFDDAVLAAVKSWKYEPAKHQDGKAFLSVKTVKIPFKIKM